MKTFISFILLFISIDIYSQGTQNSTGVSGKKYIFNYDIQLQECNSIGEDLTVYQIIPQGSTFKITHLTTNGYVIIINVYLLPKVRNGDYYAEQLDKRARLNFITNPGINAQKTLHTENDNVKHFFLSNADFNTLVAEVGKSGQWSYGTLIEPFKFRSNPSIFTSDFSLGAVVGWQGSIIKSKTWQWGFYGGLSLSKITLDSLSTNNKVKISSERPAFTPAINGIISYKGTFSLTFGIGWDFINKTSDIEKSWVYNGKKWFGIGIGVKLFTPNNETSSVQGKQAQK